MTLKEQIRPHARYWDCYNDEPELYNHTGKLVKIADEFAIGFGQWLIKKEHEYTNKIIAIEQLLEIYKKEKQL